jgi:transposase-like protein
MGSSPTTPCPQCGTPMQGLVTADTEEFTCPKCSSSLSRHMNPEKPLATPTALSRSPECPQCKVQMKPIASPKGFEQDRQIWECEECGYQIDVFR